MKKAYGNSLRFDKYLLFIIPSFIGIMVFYFSPFIISFYYSLIDNITKKNFVGIDNYISTFTNSAFQRGVGNTVIFMVVSIPLGMILSLLMALVLKKNKKFRGVITAILLLPLVIPSGSIVYFWKLLLGSNGLINKLLFINEIPYFDLSSGWFSLSVLTFMFLWKNISYNVILFWAGLNWIPQSYYEVMSLEGGGAFTSFRKITLVYLAPTSFIVLIMSIVNSFKAFKEIYMLWGAYPSSGVYLIQHYINNQLASGSLQKLSAAAYIIFIILSILLIIIFILQKRVGEE